ncbi:DNA-binding transcriptional LysR family regulator [Aeromonas caviae]|nr:MULTISPECIES: LysR family transcriptional regulator [Aeromonas]ASI25661.1 LysR family transcriptional regulator [Aeromonas salmonicida]MCP1600485.1 DNA-binding transcriptional LysR family regulator [Aeromonas caviae]QYH28390.1 LysR family transcriptional regulator [Aeromonas salmonicida subsp. masoucida]QYH32707.1 LysR family transcriptional regulator [Aeromonas salmonicida subsp. masoucida]UUI58995.1 LysR family transcriptional regulator [Aeromonas salmonicida]
MDFNATKLFIAVVNAGSFSAASERTSVPIATLSRKINELEQELNVQLLERSRQGVKPTYKGQQFFEQARLGVELLEDAHKSVTAAHSLQGKLRLSIPPNFSLWWDLLIEFQQRYPDITVFCHSSERVVDLFGDSIDVALRLGDLNSDDVIAKLLMNLETVFVASPKLLAERGTPETLTEMAQLPVAAWESLNYGFFEWSSGAEKVKYAPFFSTNHLQAIIHYALNGKAVAQLLDFSARPWLESGELIQLLPSIATQKIPLHLVYSRQKHPSVLVRAYIDFCTEWIGKLA